MQSYAGQRWKSEWGGTSRFCPTCLCHRLAWQLAQKARLRPKYLIQSPKYLIQPTSGFGDTVTAAADSRLLTPILKVAGSYLKL